MLRFNRGIVAISISLKNFDLKQCGDDSSLDNNLDPFYNTDKCDRKTTKVNILFISIINFK